MNIEEINSKLEKLKIILVNKKIIKSNESIGIQHLVKYSNFLKYPNNIQGD